MIANRYAWLWESNFSPEYSTLDGLDPDRSPSIRIMKVGGGTLGESYLGVWLVEIDYGRRQERYEMEFDVPHTHMEIAELVIDEKHNHLGG